MFDELSSEVDTSALGSLRALILSGGAATRQPTRHFEVHNLYGCSESTALSTFFNMTAEGPLARVPLGRPLQNTRIYVLADDLSPCPRYVPGQIYIGGDMVSAGYLGNSAANRERFIPNPFIDGERLFRTGDIGRWLADGVLDYLGRRDDQVKIRGMRIECGEVEHALREHPDVRDAVVVARQPDPAEPMLVGYVLVTPDAPDARELRRSLTDRLPGYMIPSPIVILDVFPRTSSGKIARNALPTPERTASSSSVAPRDDLERAIADIWCEVLELSQIGVDDEFFAVGGHSLKAARIASRIEGQLDVSVAIIDLFRHPTVAELAEAVRTRGTGSGPKIQTTTAVIAPMTDEEAELLS